MIKFAILAIILCGRMDNLFSQSNIENWGNCQFDIKFGFGYSDTKNYSTKENIVFETTVIDFLSTYLDKTDCYRVFSNVPSKYNSYGFRVSSKGCNEEIMKQKIVENINVNSVIRYKIVKDTLESWAIQVVDSNKLFTCGIYYEFEKLYERDSAGNFLYYKPSYSCKYFDNITGNFNFIGDKQQSIIENSASRFFPNGSRFLNIKTFNLDFENHLWFNIPEQIQCDVYLYKHFLHKYAGIDININEETEDKLLFYLEDTSLPVQSYIQYNFNEEAYYYPYNIKRIIK
jgi:hypothetical protein